MCPACGSETWGARELCEHHLAIDVLECAGNRILCNLIHRKVVPVRLSAEDREEVSEALDAVEGYTATPVNSEW